MNAPKITYPQYRKYTNDLAYFKIISPEQWQEIRIVGTKIMLHHFVANILPDRNYIYDMTFSFEDNWKKIEAAEYEQVLQHIEDVSFKDN